jgi:hypothetical protein
MMKKRPVAVTILSWIYIAVGAIGLAYHVNQFRTQAYHPADIWIALVGVVAIVAGVYMLHGDNWARWLAIVWIAFHVAISFLNGWQPVLVHVIIAAGIVWLLFQAEARAWFRPKAAAEI